jgi:hypothetical protein
MEYVESKLDWLRSKFEQLEKTNGRYYVLIDFPGQVELYTHHTAVKRILQALGEWGHRFVAVHLADRFVKLYFSLLKYSQSLLHRSIQVYFRAIDITECND